MDRIDEISVFAAVADANSFTQAARRLGVSPAQVSKVVARLENRLGARLLNRTTRDVSLTDTGRAYLERARQVLEDFEVLEGSVRDEHGPSGTLRISAPVSFGEAELTPALLDFAAAYPAVSLDVASSDRMVNLVEEGFDVAVRIGQLADSSLVARKIAAVRIVTCASPAYLQRRGRPKTPETLAEHEAILDANLTDSVVWRFGGGREARVRGRLRFTGAAACVAAARAGFGVARVPASPPRRTCGPDACRRCCATSSPIPSTCIWSIRTAGTWRPRCAPLWIFWRAATPASRSGTRAGPDSPSCGLPGWTGELIAEHPKRRLQRREPDGGPADLAEASFEMLGRTVFPCAGEVDQARGLARPAFGEAGDGDRELGLGLRQGAFRHGPGAGLRHRACGRQEFAGNPQHLVLGVLGVSHVAALEDVGAARQVGEERGQQAARAALGRRQHQAALGRLPENGLGQFVHRGGNGGVQGFSHEPPPHDRQAGLASSMPYWVREIPPPISAVSSCLRIFMASPTDFRSISLFCTWGKYSFSSSCTWCSIIS